MNSNTQNKSHKNRATKIGEAEREDFAYQLISSCLFNSEIKRAMKANFGMSSRTAERYMSRARARMKAEYAKCVALGKDGLDALRLPSVNFYLSVIRDEKNKISDKIKAQECLDQLFGLEAPRKVVTTTTLGRLNQYSLTGAQLDQHIIELLESC